MKKQISSILLCLLLCVLSARSIEVVVVGPPPSTRISLEVREGCAEVRFNSIRDKQYTVEFSEDLQSWVPVEEEIFSAGASVVYTNLLGGKLKGFYRTKRSDEFSITFNPACFAIGSEWNYSVTEVYPDETINFTEREWIKEVSAKNGYDVIGWRTDDSDGSLILIEYLLKDMSEGVVLVGIKDASGERTYFNPPDPSIINRFMPGVQSDPVTVPPPDTGFSSATLVETVSIDYGTVTVPAGTFQNTIKVETQLTGTYSEDGITVPYTIVETTWYARNTCEVKSYSTIAFQGYGVLGTISRELTSYTLN